MEKFIDKLIVILYVKEFFQKEVSAKCAKTRANEMGFSSPDHVLQSYMIYRTAIPEPLRSHFAKIPHKVAKSKTFSKI